MTEILTVTPSGQHDINNEFCLRKCPFNQTCVVLDGIENLSGWVESSPDSIVTRIEALVLRPQVASLMFSLVDIQTRCVDTVVSGQMPSRHTMDARNTVKGSDVGEFAGI